MKKWVMGFLMLLGMSFGLVCLGADFNGDGTGDIAVFRASSGLWAIRGVTRVYFGSSGDNVVPGDYEGNGTDAAAIFRPAGGLWAARGVTRVYFGGGSDAAKPGDYNGDGIYDIGIFRGSSGLWAVRGVTRIYYGGSTDLAIAAGTVKAPTRTINGSATAQAAGYYEAFDLAAVDTDLAAANIKTGIAIYGVSGTAVEATGDAAGGDVLSGKTFSTAGQAGLSGTMSNRGAVVITPGTANQTILAGYHNGSGYAEGDADLVSGNIRSTVSLFGISGDSNVVNTSSGDAAEGDIRTGKVAWVDGSEVTGTIPTQTVSNATVSQAAGYYDVFDLSTVDTDLAAPNIKTGVAIYGVNGSYSGSGGGLLKTGQTTSYYAGDDGTYQTGTSFSYQTSDPAANGEIVTTDNVTGLMWASNGTGAGCYSGGTRTWTQAIDWAEGLTFADYSDWRLPNRRELESIVDSGRYNPPINTVYFPNTVSVFYWSSSTFDGDTAYAWGVYFDNGNVSNVGYKTFSNYVRAVRCGE